jgi:hypothetical protein
MTGSTRNLDELMKTQVIHPNEDTVNQALKMREEVQALRKENEMLRTEKMTFESEREGYVNQINLMEKEVIQQPLQLSTKGSNGFSSPTEKKLFDDLRAMQKGFEALYEEFAELKADRDQLQTKLDKNEKLLASAKEKASIKVSRTPKKKEYYHSGNEGHAETAEELRLAEELRCLQVSCDSLFCDLDKVKKERDELKATLDSNGGSKRPTAPTKSRSSMLSWMASTITATPTSNNTTDSDESGQASFIRRAVERHASTAPNTSSNPMERKLQELEVENLKLQSLIVHLQTQLKAERYKNQQLQQERYENPSLSPRQPKRSVSLQVPFQYPDSNTSMEVDDNGDDLPSPLADEGGRSIRKLESLKTFHSPTRSASLRRIHEYRAKKDPSKETNSVSTASTKDTSGTDNSGTLDAKETDPLAASLPTTSAPATQTLGSSTRRAPKVQSTTLTSSKSAVSEAVASSHKIPLKRNNSNGLSWGRSPARNLQNQDTQRILNSHPAYRKVNRTHSGESVSSLSSNGAIDGPKRTQSLMGMIWGS